MKGNKKTLYITVIMLAAIVITTTLIVIVSNSNTVTDSSSLMVRGDYRIPLDATEEELIAFALGDILELKASANQEDLGIFDNWGGQYTGKPLILDISVKESRDVIIHCKYYGSIDSLYVTDSKGKVLTSSKMLVDNGTLTLTNMTAGTYRVEVKRYENYEAKVVFRVFSELTTPELELPELLPEKSVDITNEYGVDMEIELPTGKHIIPAQSALTIPLSEGPNNGTLKLIDKQLSSESIEVYTWADTTPPQISVEKAFEDDRASVAYVVNLLSDEPLKEMKINGEPVMVIGSDRDIGNEKLIYSHVVYVDKVTDIITIEATDLIGNHSTTKIVTAELDIGPVP